MTSRTAEIRALCAVGDLDRAAERLATLLRDLFALDPHDVSINTDQYSLNSLNGFFSAGGVDYFFKFHQEEGEEAMSGEYYRAGLLAAAGLPVDMPVYTSSEPGTQILVYRRRTCPRFADVLRLIEAADDPAERRRAVAAERDLARRLAAVYLASLHPISPEQAAAEPIHRLFHQRIVDPATGAYPAGRLASFYVGQRFRFPGADLDWAEFSRLRFVVNGVRYRRSVGELFDQAAERLRPDRLAGAGVVAHGDAHNANVWYERDGDRARLDLYDPAFAGEHVPSLLAEVKPAFHNVFAHPAWLYEPDDGARLFSATASVEGSELRVEYDWALTPLRADLLAVRAEEVWRPLLREMADRALLPPDWREVVRLALFLCPTLVLNLRAGAALHNPTTSLLGFAIAVMCGSEPVAGEDAISRFLDSIVP